MPVKGNSSSERTTRWDVLLTNVKSSLPDMPHIADDFKALETLLLQARALETQREDLRSQASVASGELVKALSEGDKIRARMGSTLKGKFGFTDATLRKYGFKPVAIRRRKSSPPPPAAGDQGTPVAPPPGTNPPPPPVE
jgi:hypothetical protein